MADTYRVGNDSTPILIQIQVGSAANCQSKVIRKTGGDTVILIPPFDGSLDPTSLGTGAKLSGSALWIETIAGLKLLPDSAIEEIKADKGAVAKYVRIDYGLEGGPDGSKKFHYLPGEVTLSSDFTQAFILKTMNLVA